ncbi:MAG: HD domain-containing protein [Paludibacterium sp.]|uniref:HD-GYP domain-containing protein n=1 Tax=Paludibacterium sp. TaxID=1917523 RepID=UPI0025E926A7|nr:HD domain-containing phosphohydrolase [Paludibacterium sp.]MBV8049252.1 HD domain-containing protein [Paludibacterium sp.]MBV8648266.1 HD domain-containing protein [Paludibacterium sp.]
MAVINTEAHSHAVLNVRLFDMIAALSTTLDLLDPQLGSHQKRTCLIAAQIGMTMSLPLADYQSLFIAAIFHDIGALALHDRLRLLAFEDTEPHQHAQMGAQLLARFDTFQPYAPLLAFHHVPWAHGEGQTFEGQPVPMLSHLIHLADRIEVLAQGHANILAEVGDIRLRVQENSGAMFCPEQVNAFMQVSQIERFWLDLFSVNLDQILRALAPFNDIELDLQQLMRFAQFFALIIDSRSHFTTTHSAGVAICAETLAKYMGMSEVEAAKMRIAGYLHDTGKLAVPCEYINRGGPLTWEETARVRAHSYITHDILSRINGLGDIAEWASHHHERLDGSGYPFHKSADRLSLGSRIMAVADVYTALSEDRPYRAGLPAPEVFAHLEDLVAARQLEATVVAVLKHHHDRIGALCHEVQQREGEALNAFWRLAGN